MDIHAEVLRVVLRQASPDRMGELVPWESFLTLRGHLVSTSMRLDPRHEGWGDYHPGLDLPGPHRYKYRMTLDDDFYIRQLALNQPAANPSEVELKRYPFPVYCLSIGRRDGPPEVVVITQDGYTRPSQLVYFLVLRRIDVEDARMIEAVAEPGSEEHESSNQHRCLRIGWLEVFRGDSLLRADGLKKEVVTIY